MIAQAKWVELTFNFDIPPGKYPMLVERLSATPIRLEEKISDSPFMILEQPYNNGWSIQEHAGHLLDLEELILQRLDDYDAGSDILTPADLTNRKTHDANHNDANINHILKAFRSSRAAIINRLNNYNEQEVLRTAVHPRLHQPMRLIDLVYFSAEHDDHHLATISRLINELE